MPWMAWRILFIQNDLLPGERCETAMSVTTPDMIYIMKKEQLARQLARESHVSPAAAADQLDRIVSDLLMRVRRGQAASLPGLGTFRPGSQKEFQFDRDQPKKGSK